MIFLDSAGEPRLFRVLTPGVTGVKTTTLRLPSLICSSQNGYCERICNKPLPVNFVYFGDLYNRVYYLHSRRIILLFRVYLCL